MTTDDQDLPKTARVLLVVDQPVLARVIQLALAHGPYLTQVAATIVAADATLDGVAAAPRHRRYGSGQRGVPGAGLGPGRRRSSDCR